MNLPNLISASRFVFSGLFLLIFYLPAPVHLNPLPELILLVSIFAVSEFTDFLDGHIARRQKITSQLGKLLDPFTDTIAHTTFLFCFFSLHIVPTYLILIIIYRELGAVFLRLLFQIKGITQPARIMGKIKSNCYGVAAGMALVYYGSLSLQNPLGDVYTLLMQLVYTITALLSIFSFIDHLIVYLKTPFKDTTS